MHVTIFVLARARDGRRAADDAVSDVRSTRSEEEGKMGEKGKDKTRQDKTYKP